MLTNIKFAESQEHSLLFLRLMEWNKWSPTRIQLQKISGTNLSEILYTWSVNEYLHILIHIMSPCQVDKLFKQCIV